MLNILNVIGRSNAIFTDDIAANENNIKGIVESSSFLVLGAAGTIGQAVSKEIFKRNPAKLDLVDISENNLVELVRDLRSSVGYTDGVFRTFALDINSPEYDAFFNADGHYDYVLNLSALKHVRSEKDPYTLMRMINTNIFATQKTVRQAIAKGVKKYFCVSTDKAANPVNMMGASKRIMEMFLLRYAGQIDISSARFANVAFSDGSLLHGFNQRLLKQQPIVAPKDIKRYFLTPQESGELCLMSCLLGQNRELFFPKLSAELQLTSFADIAVNFLSSLGYKAVECASEDEARSLAGSLPATQQWPCLFTLSDTTGEKAFEEFYTDAETVLLDKFANVGIVANELVFDENKLASFEAEIARLLAAEQWRKQDLLVLFNDLIPGFAHHELGKYLDDKM